MPEDFRYDVFLSHSANNKAVVRPISRHCHVNETIGRFAGAGPPCTAFNQMESLL